MGTVTVPLGAGHVTIEVSDDARACPPVSSRTSSTASIAPPRPATRIRAPPGSGLGLAIAAEIAAAHGGTAHASAVQPHGLGVTLTVPARVCPAPRPRTDRHPRLTGRLTRWHVPSGTLTFAHLDYRLSK